MPLTAFPEPPDLNVDFVNRTGDSRPLSFQKYDVSNPHPGFGKDPNILNEYGHTKYPMWVFSKIENKRIIVNSPMEEAQHTGEEAQAKPLKQDGPTIGQWIAGGYKAKDYPPEGYAPKSTKEEIDAAINAATGWPKA